MSSFGSLATCQGKVRLFNQYLPRKVLHLAGNIRGSQ